MDGLYERRLKFEVWFDAGSYYIQVGHTPYGGGFWIPGWHHIAGVLDKSTEQMKLYMNGERIGDRNAGLIKVRNSIEGLKIGMFMAGQIDAVRISDTVRYSGETYLVPVSPFECDDHTRALWHFDEFEGSTVFHDACGVDNILTGYNGAHTEGVPRPTDICMLPSDNIPMEYKLGNDKETCKTYDRHRNFKDSYALSFLFRI